MVAYWVRRARAAKTVERLEQRVTEPPPLFRGLAACGVSGRDIAQAAGVAASTVSRWRNGRLAVPPETLQFLTLVLADRLQSRRAACGGDGGLLQPRQRGALKVPTEALREQEALNVLLTPMAVREGIRRFRHWYAAAEVIARGRAASGGRASA